GTLMRDRDDLIVQGRIAWFFAGQSGKPSFNLLLTVDPKVGAERKTKEGGYPGKTADEALALNRRRENEELAHYRALYGIENFLDPAHYTFALDTTNLTEDEVMKKVLDAVKK
ncbi:MAG TPA: hypothetical protein VMT81_01350, partial [Candidatus Paceibacterota bacterium]|nr:hypothetical protein [Candidatus Paceibacterota bacterium]